MKVLLVDDHPLILSALQGMIKALDREVVVQAVESAEQARAALRADAGFDLVLLDLALGDVDGFEVLAELRRGWPAVPVVVVSASERTSDVIRAIDLGAMGFVPKRSANAVLLEALRLVMTGGLYVPPTLISMPGAGGSNGAAQRRVGDHATPAPHQQTVSLESIGLTPRQHEVLGLLLQGLPNKLIARKLQVSVETVKDHVAAVLRALNVSSRTQAVLAVSQMTQGRTGVTGAHSARTAP